MNLSGSTRLWIGDDDMDMREKLTSLPYSYDILITEVG